MYIKKATTNTATEYKRTVECNNYLKLMLPCRVLLGWRDLLGGRTLAKYPPPRRSGDSAHALTKSSRHIARTETQHIQRKTNDNCKNNIHRMH